MLARLTHIFLSFFTSRFEGIITTTVFSVAQQFLNKGRQTLLLLVSCFVLSILFTAGVIISTLEAAAQYDARGSIFFTALLTSSLIMVGISSVALALIFWPRQSAPLVAPEQSNALHPHPLEEILTTAIAEGVQYFKSKSEQTSRSRSTGYSQV